MPESRLSAFMSDFSSDKRKTSRFKIFAPWVLLNRAWIMHKKMSSLFQNKERTAVWAELDYSVIRQTTIKVGRMMKRKRIVAVLLCLAATASAIWLVYHKNDIVGWILVSG